jgi:CRISPR-associated endonuclease Cas3-HD
MVIVSSSPPRPSRPGSTCRLARSSRNSRRGRPSSSDSAAATGTGSARTPGSSGWTSTWTTPRPITISRTRRTSSRPRGSSWGPCRTARRDRPLSGPSRSRRPCPSAPPSGAATSSTCSTPRRTSSATDLDVSPLVRDAEDTDLRVYWRWFEGEEPPPDEAPPTREETCRVSRRGARDFLRALARRADRERARGGAADRFRAFAWDPLEEAWRPTRRALPGQTILLHADAGGYERELGWTGTVGSTTPPVPAETRSPGVEDAMDADHDTSLGRWIPLLEHLEDVKREAEELADALGLPTPLRRAITDAAAWHDVGKAHEEFQRRLLEPVRDDPELRPDGSGPWAKSNHRRRPPGGRPFFRHELASALSRRALDDGDAGLVSYLVAAHHGKVRLSIPLRTRRGPPPGSRPPLRARDLGRRRAPARHGAGPGGAHRAPSRPHAHADGIG